MCLIQPSAHFTPDWKGTRFSGDRIREGFSATAPRATGDRPIATIARHDGTPREITVGSDAFFVLRAAPLPPPTAFVILSGRDLASEAARIAALPAIKSVLAKPLVWGRVADEILRVGLGADAPA